MVPSCLKLTQIQPNSTQYNSLFIRYETRSFDKSPTRFKPPFQKLKHVWRVSSKCKLKTFVLVKFYLCNLLQGSTIKCQTVKLTLPPSSFPGVVPSERHPSTWQGPRRSFGQQKDASQVTGSIFYSDPRSARPVLCCERYVLLWHWSDKSAHDIEVMMKGESRGEW